MSVAADTMHFLGLYLTNNQFLYGVEQTVQMDATPSLPDFDAIAAPGMRLRRVTRGIRWNALEPV
jgi:hypothetical protein